MAAKGGGVKAIRRLKRKLRALKVRNVGLLRELAAMQARYHRLATRATAGGVKK